MALAVDTCEEHLSTGSVDQSVVCIAAKEVEKQLCRLKQNLAAEGQELDEGVVCTCLMTWPAAFALASSCFLLHTAKARVECEGANFEQHLSMVLQEVDELMTPVAALQAQLAAEQKANREVDGFTLVASHFAFCLSASCARELSLAPSTHEPTSSHAQVMLGSV